MKLKATKQEESEVDDITDESSDDVSTSSDSDVELSTFKYLEGTSHYDCCNRAVLQCVNVVAEDSNDGQGLSLVIYRSKLR